MNERNERTKENKEEKVNKIENNVNNQSNSTSEKVPKKIEGKNTLQRTIALLEILKDEGVDILMIPQTTAGKATKMKEVDANNIEEIMEKYDLDPELEIGKKIRVLKRDFSNKNNFNDYNKTKEDRKRFNELELFTSNYQNIKKTIKVLEILQKNGIDYTTLDKEVQVGDTTRRRYLCEIEDKNIDKVIEENNLLRYYAIGKRIDQARSYICSIQNKKERREYIKNKLIDLKINPYKNPYKIEDKVEDKLDDKVKEEKTEEIKENKQEQNNKEENKEKEIIENIEVKQEEKVEAKTEENKETKKEEKEKTNKKKTTVECIEIILDNGIDLTKMPYKIKDPKTKKKRYVKLSDLGLTKKQISFFKENGIEVDYEIGLKLKALIENVEDYKGSSEYYKIKEIATLRANRSHKERLDNVISIMNMIRDFEIEMMNMSFLPVEEVENKDGNIEKAQRSLKIKDLNLTEEELEKLKVYNVDEDYNLGYTLINIRQAYKGIGDSEILDEEDVESLKDLNIIQKEESRKSIEEKIIKLEYLSNKGINIPALKKFDKNKENNKRYVYTLKDLREDLEEELWYIVDDFEKEFKLDDSYQIGKVKAILTDEYKRGRLEKDFENRLEEIDLVSELEKKNNEQIKLEKELRKLELLKEKLEKKNV